MARLIVGGGLNENADPDISECFSGYNFELSTKTTQFRPRAPLDLKGSTTGSISGILQLVKRTDAETTLIFADDAATPTIYLWNGAATFTSKRTNSLAITSKLRDVYWPLDDYIIITDLLKLTPILQWDGTTCIRQKTALSSGSVAVTIASSGTTATVTESSHTRVSGDLVVVSGAVESEYNGEFEITKTGTNTYTYVMASDPAGSAATGSPVVATGTPLYAKYGLVHQGRLWLFNVKAGSADTPHLMVASAFETPTSFSTVNRAADGVLTANVAFYMLTPNLKPINGAFFFQDQLIISTTNGKLFQLTGTDTTNYAWVDFYSGSAAIGTETAVNAGNDALYMREGGNIESLSATQNYGDVRTDDLSRFIPDTVKDLTNALAVYDQTNQKVFFFVANKVLVYFKDFAGQKVSPWSVYKTTLANRFNAVSAKYMVRPGLTTRSVYFGDSSGNIYDMNGSGTSGDGGTETIKFSRQTKTIDTPIGTLVGNVRYRRTGQCDLQLNFDWSDEYNISSSTITLKGPITDNGLYWGGDNYWGGTNYWNQGFAFTDKVSTRGFSPTGIGESVKIEVYLATNVQFEIDHIEI